MANRNRLIAQRLTPEDFTQFGTFADMINSTSVNTFGDLPIQFMPDMLELNTGGKNPSFSICRVTNRPMVVDTTEFHSRCGEGILPLDDDVYIHVGPPTPDDKPPLGAPSAWCELIVDRLH